MTGIDCPGTYVGPIQPVRSDAPFEEARRRLDAAPSPARGDCRPNPRRQGEAMIVLGEALKMRYQLCELARRHRIPDPAPIATVPLLEPVEHDLIVEGLAATPDVDRHRMKFRPWCFSFLPWEKLPPLRYRHAEPAGELEDMRFDERGRLLVRARVTHPEAKRCSHFSVAALIEAWELRDADDPQAFHSLITAATIADITLTDRPCNPAAIVRSADPVTHNPQRTTKTDQRSSQPGLFVLRG
jgi:hypothetical protein